MAGREIFVTTFYRLFDFSDHEFFAKNLKQEFLGTQLLGTTIVCEFGISSTVAGPRNCVDSFKDYCRKKFGNDLLFSDSISNISPFRKFKVVQRGEILNVGLANQYRQSPKKSFLSPAEWADLLRDASKKIALIDARNHYEYSVGTYKGAIEFEINNFREFFSKFVEYVNSGGLKNKDGVAIFCTGGVRCDLIAKEVYDMIGNDIPVYQLHTGILGYLSHCKKNDPESATLWDGDCFVFDDRFAVNKNLETVQNIKCNECFKPTSEVRRMDKGVARCADCAK